MNKLSHAQLLNKNVYSHTKKYWAAFYVRTYFCLSYLVKHLFNSLLV